MGSHNMPSLLPKASHWIVTLPKRPPCWFGPRSYNVESEDYAQAQQLPLKQSWSGSVLNVQLANRRSQHGTLVTAPYHGKPACHLVVDISLISPILEGLLFCFHWPFMYSYLSCRVHSGKQKSDSKLPSMSPPQGQQPQQGQFFYLRHFRNN